MLVMFCGLTLAQDDVNEIETQLSFPEMSVLLQELGALKEKSEALETKLEETENQVLVLNEKASTKVVFSAEIGGNGAIGPYSTSKTLIYTSVLANLGNAYNQHTGIFVAPVRGMYYFSFFYHAGGGFPVGLDLMKNNQVVVRSAEHKSSYDFSDNGGNAAFVELQQGDHVYVQLDANHHVWGSGYSTTFSGFLLHQV
ncbi:complement C1q-like protein 2 [Poecilia reticulata]|uniref:complement C1q-like protein 2 n=1 Tax=Poecilia reticulata TaxID=8081 RepID=UPI0007E9D599|nr:PREDICTED: complement C1q-like protein 2 [Poecilia reticulata]